MISGNKFKIFVNTIFNIRSSLFVPVLGIIAAETTSVTSHKNPQKEGTSLKHRLTHPIIKNLNQEHDYHKSTKFIYGSSCVNHSIAADFSGPHRFISGYHNTTPVFNLHTNIIMLVEMLATGLPFVGWRVKPDPGD